MIVDTPPPLDASLTLPERIYRQMRQEIVEGKIPAGSKISEPELAKRYGVSRAPLRETISRLEACRLVVRKPNVGARVVSLSLSSLLELYELREVMEGLGARLAARNMTDTEREDLQSLLREHQEQGLLQEGVAYFQKEGDLDFHYSLVRGSHNQHLIDLLCNDHYHLLRMYRYQFGMPGSRAKNAFREHEYIVDAIVNRDSELAEMLMRRHIRSARDYIESQFKNANR